ncbi:MAG: GAF domain-containing protein [Actinomycetota bacterium]|nr:GAF domain-containing protein [Actinomycetota bacterium]
MTVSDISDQPDPVASGLTLDDPDRVAAVHRYEILDAPRDGTFERIARLAAGVFGTPISTVSIVDTDRVWFAARHGLDGVDQVGVEPGLCASAVFHDGPYVVNDAVVDPRTLDHPLVRGELGLRFYAAAPIVTADGHRLGTVTVIDTEPHEVTDTSALTQLAEIVADNLELRLAAITAVRTERQLAITANHQVAKLANDLRLAADRHHDLTHPTRCQLGKPDPCATAAELKVADPWGDSAWACMAHAETIILTVPSVFIADEQHGGLATYLRA